MKRASVIRTGVRSYPLESRVTERRIFVGRGGDLGCIAGRSTAGVNGDKREMFRPKVHSKKDSEGSL